MGAGDRGLRRVYIELDGVVFSGSNKHLVPPKKTKNAKRTSGCGCDTDATSSTISVRLEGESRSSGRSGERGTDVLLLEGKATSSVARECVTSNLCNS